MLTYSGLGLWFICSVLMCLTEIRKPLPHARTSGFQVKLHSCLYHVFASSLNKMRPVLLDSMFSAVSQVLACITLQSPWGGGDAVSLIETSEMHSLNGHYKISLFLQLWVSVCGMKSFIILVMFIGYLLDARHARSREYRVD